MDTPVVNGVAYPYLQVQPKAYRLRILNASNDRTLNLSLYQAPTIPACSLSGGKLFYRLAQQAVQIEPIPFAKLIKPQPVGHGGVK